MKATYTTRAIPEMLVTEHRLSVVIEGVEYVEYHVLPRGTYACLDPAFAPKMIESYLWANLMRTIVHQLRKAAHANAKDSDR